VTHSDIGVGLGRFIIKAQATRDNWEREQPISTVMKLCSLKSGLLYWGQQARLDHRNIVQDPWPIVE